MGAVPDPDVAARAAICHWSSLTALAEFAVRRHGYGNTDGGFGVTYPGDLDEYDRATGAPHIPKGFVRVYGFWGTPNGYEVLVPESVYRDTLATVLSAAGHASEAARVAAQKPDPTA